MMTVTTKVITKVTVELICDNAKRHPDVFEPMVYTSWVEADAINLARDAGWKIEGVGLDQFHVCPDCVSWRKVKVRMYQAVRKVFGDGQYNTTHNVPYNIIAFDMLLAMADSGLMVCQKAEKS